MTGLVLTAVTTACNVMLGIGEDRYRFDGASADSAPDVATGPASDGANPGFEGGEAGGVDSGGAFDGGPNLTTNGDFELGCTGWSKEEGTLAPSNVAKSGTTACRICSAGSLADSATVIYQPLTPEPNGKAFVLEAWVRRAPGETATPTVELFADDDQSTLANQQVTLTDEWQRLRTPFTLTTRVEISIGVARASGPTPIPDGQCMLVDDVTLRAMP